MIWVCLASMYLTLLRMPCNVCTFERYFSIFLPSFAIQKQSKWAHNKTHYIHTHAYSIQMYMHRRIQPIELFIMCVFYHHTHSIRLVLKNIKWWCAHHKIRSTSLLPAIYKIVCDIYSRIHSLWFFLQFWNEKDRKNERTSGGRSVVVDKGKLR